MPSQQQQRLLQLICILSCFLLFTSCTDFKSPFNFTLKVDRDKNSDRNKADQQEQSLTNSRATTLEKNYNTTFTSAQLQDNDYDISTDLIQQDLHLSVICYSKNHISVQIMPPDQKAQLLPDEVNEGIGKSPLHCNIDDEAKFEIKVEQKPFKVIVRRQDTQDILLDLHENDILYSHSLIQISNSLHTKHIYGLGGSLKPFKATTGTSHIWTNSVDQHDPKVDYRRKTFGHHPTYLGREEHGGWHVFLMRNTYPMDIEFTERLSKGKLTYKMTGGPIDFHIFLSEDKEPQSAIKGYHQYLGKWAMTPFWAHGFHYGRSGYQDIYEVKKELYKNLQKDVIFDGFWMDIDYTVNETSFSYDLNSYPPAEMREVFAEQKRKWVPTIRSGITKMPDDAHLPSFKFSEFQINKVPVPILQTQFYIKSFSDGLIEGKQGKQQVYLVDFFEQRADQHWAEMLREIEKHYQYNGIYLDLNGPYNDCDGFCDQQTTKFKNLLDAARSIPHTPGGDFIHKNSYPFDFKHNEIKGPTLLYSLSLYNFYEARATSEQMKSRSPLTFVMTQTSIFGTQKYAQQHFTNFLPSWNILRDSIGAIFRMGLFGFPFTGVDICGTYTTSDAELCARWIQIGAYYPFARQYMNKGQRHHQPQQFGSVYKTVHAQSRKLHYQLAKHTYSQFLNQDRAGMVFVPLFYNFPNDKNLFETHSGGEIIESQFMIGNTLMVAPVLRSNVGKVDVYFPYQARWYDIQTLKEVKFEDSKDSIKDRSKLIEVPLQKPLPVYLRGGSMVFMQNAGKVEVVSDLSNIFEIYVGLDDQYKSRGEIADLEDWSDDKFIDSKCFVYEDCMLDIDVDVNMEEGKLTLRALRRKGNEFGTLLMKNLRIMGLDGLEIFEGKKEQSVEMYGRQYKIEYENCVKGATGCLFVEFDPVLDLKHGVNYSIGMTIENVGEKLKSLDEFMKEDLFKLGPETHK